MYSHETLEAVGLAQFLSGIYVICDDVYNRLAYDEGYERFAVLAQLEQERLAKDERADRAFHGLTDRTVVVDSFSKPWAMTGWRLGWLAAPRELKAQIREDAPVPRLERTRVRAGRRCRGAWVRR